MKICKQCDNPVEDSMQVCPYCSYQFEVPKQKKTGNEKKKNAKDVTSAPGKSPKQNPGTISSVGAGGTGSTGASSGSSAGRVSTAGTATKPKKKGNLGTVIVIALLVYIVIKLYGAWSEGVLDLPVLSKRDNGYSEQSLEAGKTEESIASSAVESTAESVQESSAEAVEETPGYILPYSNSMYYSREDLVGLSKEELRIARNEIYARHGRRFNDAKLQEYFDAQDWYSGDVAPGDFSDSVFNEYEAYNKDLIVAYEKELQ